MASDTNQWPNHTAAKRERITLDRLLSSGSAIGSLSPPAHYGPHPDQIYEVIGDPGHPIVLLLHGGFFRPRIDRTHLRPLACALSRHGWRVVLAEYRRIPSCPLVSVEDLRCLELHLRSIGLGPSRVIGHSAGGMLALLRTLSPTFDSLPPVEVVALAAVSDAVRAATDLLGCGAIQAWIGGEPQERPLMYAKIDPAQLVCSGRRVAARTFLVHGRYDCTVPYEYSESLLRMTQRSALYSDTAPNNHCCFLIVEGNHFDLVDPYRVEVMKLICGV